jgi:putative ABC transport system permease protein|tara:strand:- start:11667 stop:12818 length:1152 start_codon:yes stop_codon:yes gene_type:complete
MIGIFIGIAAVVSLIGLGEGLKLAINSQFGVSSVEVLTIQAGGITAAGPPGTGVVNPLTDDDVEVIEDLPQIESAIPRHLETGRLEFNDNVVFGLAMSIPDGDDRKFAYDALDIKTEEGRLLKDGDSSKVVLGYNFLDDAVGLEKPVRVGNRVIIQDKSFDVVGITEKKGSFIFDNIVHMNEEVLKDVFERNESVDVIIARVKENVGMDDAKESVERVLREQRDVKIGEEDFSVQTPEAALSTLNDILLGVQIFIAMIASISVLVGALGIVNTMFTSVLERRKNIGTMKAVGARNSDIFKIFFIESGLLGLMGGIIGVILGSIASYFGIVAINNFVGASTTPQINFVLIASMLIASFVIGSVAGIIPAMQAARKKPVDALRGF